MSNVTLLGLGAMGTPMAGHLARAGHTVRGWNRTLGRPTIEGVTQVASLKEALSGADAVVLDGLSRANGRSDAFARRQARNTQAVLMEEAHLGRVDDPAAGSWFLDARTRDLAEAGWAEFQRIEREGGIVASLKGDAIQMRVAAALAGRKAALAGGAAHLVGVTKFVDPGPRPAPFESIPQASAPGGGDTCVPLPPVRFAEAFETSSPEARP